MPFNEISGQTLEMIVLDFDRFGKHDQIGQVSVQLGKIDLATTIEKTVDIESPPVCMCVYSRCHDDELSSSFLFLCELLLLLLQLHMLLWSASRLDTCQRCILLLNVALIVIRPFWEIQQQAHAYTQLLPLIHTKSILHLFAINIYSYIAGESSRRSLFGITIRTE